MTVQSLMIHSVVIVKPGLRTTRAGDTARDWGNPVRIASRCWINPSAVHRQSEEQEALSDRTVLPVQMFFLPQDDIANEDRVEWGTRKFDVVGPPRLRYTQRGLHHLEVQCREVVG